MPNWSQSKRRRLRAFNDGRRAAVTGAKCLLKAPTLMNLWKKGFRMQRDGQLRDRIPNHMTAHKKKPKPPGARPRRRSHQRSFGGPRRFPYQATHRR
jgi:hypothetical protein